MADQLRFDGRVAIVTGAGAGLGRSYALLFAERGASVVVNDLGGGRHGDGSGTRAADEVVNEIRHKGGKAVANYNSVEDGDKIVETALQNFGRIDIIVNNAGVLRDRSFARISDADWDIIQNVHLKGSFKTTQAAWPHFRKQNYGRIIMTSSNSGLYGNFGQANYSAAKMGLVGLSNTLSIEGQKSNIHCNVIVPTAGSRLTEDILPPEFFQELKPELIAPVVVWLCHESCPDNGTIVESAAGWAGKCYLVRSEGSILRRNIGDSVTPEAVRDRWNAVTDMSTASHLDSIQEASGNLMQVLEEMKAGVTGPSSSVGETVDGEAQGEFSFIDKDLVLYALGVGASIVDESNLRFLYEGHEDFEAIPTYWIIPGMITVMSSELTRTAVPGKEVDLSKILHGEQYLEVLKPVSTSGTLKSRCRVVDVMDKGSGAVIVIDVDTYDEEGEKVTYGQMNVFVVGAGKFGGKRSSDKAKPTVSVPSRRPDASIQQKTSIDQAAIYRLSGDRNPLHIDPSFAALGGFDRPILHGLCSLGFSTRHVLQQYAGNDASKFKAIKVRFVKPVFPGQTLQTDMWKEGTRIHFQTKVVETGNIVITGAYIDLTEASSDSPAIALNKLSTGLRCELVFQGMEGRIQADPKEAKKINAVFLYNITKNKKVAAKWTVDLKEGVIYQGDPKSGKADCTVTVDDDDMMDIAMGTINPQVAFLKGKVKVSGNIMLQLKMQKFMREEAKL